VAATLAVLSAGHHRTTLVSDDLAAAAAVLGVARSTDAEAVEVTPTLALAAEPVAGAQVVVIDGAPTADGPERHAGDEHYVVLRGPCYLALSSVLAASVAPDGIILVVERGRSLTARDVAEVLGVPVLATVEASPAVARTIDAGLLLMRLHRLRELSSLRALAAKPPRSRTNRVRDHRPAPSCQTSTPILQTHTDLPCPLGGHGVEGLTRRQDRWFRVATCRRKTT
jgi:hypothetical protein